MNTAVSRTHWFLFGTAVLLLVAGSLAARLSSSPSVLPLTLSPNRSVSYTVLRLLPDSAHITLHFRGFRRPELGSYRSQPGDGFILFESPGEPVVIEVQGPRSVATYEALPADGTTHNRRALVVRDMDNDARRFQWPPNNASRPVLPIGVSTVTLTVLRVGDPLSGEEVSAILEPPLSFKSHAPEYGLLWWFLFWPVFAVPILAYAAHLIWRVHRSRRHSPSAA